MPEPLGIAAVECIGGDAIGEALGPPVSYRGLVAMVEIAPAHPLDQWRCGEQHGGRGTLLRCLPKVFRGSQPASVALQIGRDGAGIERVRPDAVVRPALGNSYREQNAGGLGLSVGKQGIIGNEAEMGIVPEQWREQAAG